MGRPTESVPGSAGRVLRVLGSAEAVIAAAKASRLSSLAMSLRRNSRRIWKKSRTTDGHSPSNNRSRSSTPAGVFLSCRIGLPLASAQEKASGWISRTMRRPFSQALSSLSTYLILGTIAKVCRVSPFPLALRLIRPASSYVAETSAARTGARNTLPQADSPERVSAKQDHPALHPSTPNSVPDSARDRLGLSLWRTEASLTHDIRRPPLPTKRSGRAHDTTKMAWR